MDAQRNTFVLIIAALFAGTALAAPPSESAPVRYSNTAPSQSSWPSSAPTAPPTISTSSSNRYSYPPATYPQNAAPTTGNNGVRTAGNGTSSTAQQSFGTASYPSQPTNPFTTQPAAPPATSTTGKNLAPPPWPTNSGTLSPPPASNWNSSAPITPVDRSVLANPTPPPTNVGWTSIGTTVAAPPLIVPPLPSTGGTLPSLNSSSFDSGPALTTDSYRGNQPRYDSTQYPAPPSASPANSRPAAAPDNWAASFDGSTDNNRASIERTVNTPSRSVTNRDSDYPTSPRIGSNQPDTRNTAAKPTDSWIDTSWNPNSQTPAGAAATIGGTKTAAIGSAPNSVPVGQPPNNAPPLGPPTIGPAGNNTNFAAQNPSIPQQQTAVNVGKPTQAATGEPQPWATLLFAILGLAGSLAGNIYLGWSYMDARQKYQALVRRTADTFRRTKVAA